MIEQETASLADFVGWPLLPLRGGRLGLMNPLDRSTTIRPCTGAEWSSAVLDAVEMLDCRCSQSQLCIVHFTACHDTALDLNTCLSAHSCIEQPQTSHCHFGMLRVLKSHKALEHPRLSAHVHDGDGTGLLAALSIAIGTVGPAHAMFDRQQITPMQRRALRYQMYSSLIVHLTGSLPCVLMALCASLWPPGYMCPVCAESCYYSSGG